jgi:hypothetical protein
VFTSADFCFLPNADPLTSESLCDVTSLLPQRVTLLFSPLFPFFPPNSFKLSLHLYIGHHHPPHLLIFIVIVISHLEINCFLNSPLFFLTRSIMSAHNKPLETLSTKLNGPHLKQRRHSKTQSAFNYDNTSSNLTATTMRNELNKLVDTAPPAAREVIFFQSSIQISSLVHNLHHADSVLQKFRIEMDNFFALFQRYLSDKAKGNEMYQPVQGTACLIFV